MLKSKSIQELFLVTMLLFFTSCGKESVMDEYIDLDSDSNAESVTSTEAGPTPEADLEVLKRWLSRWYTKQTVFNARRKKCFSGVSQDAYGPKYYQG